MKAAQSAGTGFPGLLNNRSSYLNGQEELNPAWQWESPGGRWSSALGRLHRAGVGWGSSAWCSSAWCSPWRGTAPAFLPLTMRTRRKGLQSVLMKSCHDISFLRTQRIQEKQQPGPTLSKNTLILLILKTDCCS